MPKNVPTSAAATLGPISSGGPPSAPIVITTPSTAATMPRPGSDADCSAMSILVQIESAALLRLPLAERSCHRATLALEGVAPPVADLHGILQTMPHYFVGEMSRELFRTAIPETDLPF